MNASTKKSLKSETSALSVPSHISYVDVQKRIVVVRQQAVILDADVAALYGVETKRVNEAVRNNPDKFPPEYLFTLDKDESSALRSKISTLENKSGRGHHSKHGYKAFTERGLYMLATILKSRQAVETTFAIIETFAQVRGLKRDLLALNRPETKGKRSLMQRFGETLHSIVMPDPDIDETQASLELNFLIGKVKYTVRRIRKNQGNKEV